MLMPKLFKYLFFRKVMKETTLDAIKNPQTTFIDVRNSEELEEDGALEKAKHIPLIELPERIEEIKTYATPIVIFCKSGCRAGRAKEFLDENGFEKVFNGGGYTDVMEILNNQN